ncbi:N-acyl-D-amino-acid deacylase family protein [Sciscionella marina]|uniref:N-acyl-D-amino-acid deacylase family protein n=1 Tax=Sciscionella marina TaxID=508770 RepID=UPI000369584A|nr:D-aminoacylase [Sciscionella marina]
MERIFGSATVIDGTGADRYQADVVLSDGRIAEVAAPGTRHGANLIDATGLVLCPGFVDMHAHSDLALLTEPEHLAKVSQGVTCDVIGQDGLSYAPCDDRTLAALRAQIAGWNGNPPDFDFSWRSVGEYLDRLDAGITINAAYLVPQGTVRMLGVGFDDRAASEDELTRMRELVAQGMEQGAFGLSSGLTYTPGMYASTAELIALCAVVAEHGGYYSPHHRGYGAHALGAYAEMVDVSTRSGCPLHLAHATMNFDCNAGRAGELLALLDAAIAEGADITLDTYPYLPGATTLSALLPSWAFSGGVEDTLERLADADTRERIRYEMEELGSDGCHGVPVDWSAIEINGAQDTSLVGASVAESAARRGKTPSELYFDVLVSERLAPSCLMHIGHEGNVRAIMRHPAHTAGSDGLLHGPRPHPRAWGTFPRYLGHYCRELGVLGLEDCVHHMTGRPAARLGLRHRGVLTEGAVADLVLFDPETVADRAEFDRPRQLAAGIERVLVGGVTVYTEGAHTGAFPGKALRHNG